MIFSEEVRIRLEPFLKRYIDFKDGAYKDEIITSIAVKQAIKRLITGEIFTADELTKLILQETDVLMPIKVIEEMIN